MLLRASAVSQQALGEIAEVRPGLSTGGRLEHEDNGTHQLILSRHLTPGTGYRYTSADRFTIKPGRDPERYLIRTGDVLFMSRGTRNVASWIESAPPTSVASVSFYILRPGPAADAGYLTWWLNQPIAQRAIADIRTGAGTPIVQRKPFTELHLPLPDLAMQRQIAQVGEAMTRERILLEQLTAAIERLHQLTSEHIARDLLARAERDDDE